MATGSTGSWASQYKDPRWQKKRLEIMERDGFACRSCGATDKTLNVHHAYYEKGKKPWEYLTRTLVTLCEDCHKHRHELQKDILIEIANMSPEILSAVHHMIVINGAEPLFLAVQAIARDDGFVDFDMLSKTAKLLNEAYQTGAEDAQ